MIDVLIIGAGAAGLMAARELTKQGLQVTVLEARNRLGGRVYTQQPDNFSIPVEAGAEFVHGDLPLTQALFQEAPVALHLLDGKNYQVLRGVLKESEEFIPDFEELLTRLEKLEQDLPFVEFLKKYLPEEEYRELREGVTRFAEGYDAADINRASTFALRTEWQTDGAANSYHPAGGYSQIIELLAHQVQAAGGTILTTTPVQEITWQPHHVQVKTTTGATYLAYKVLITVPLGVLQANAEEEGSIRFSPELPHRQKALAALGFGAVIKILLEFKSPFWEEKTENAAVKQKMPELAFLFTDASAIAAWWTQLPNQTPVLTGWIAGTEAEKRRQSSANNLIAEALETLAFLFTTTTAFLQEQLVASQVYNWAADPFARGAYAYATVNGAVAQQTLRMPEANTLYFAGEAFYEGPAIGTVEAALVSGTEAASYIINSFSDK
ncbi:flavin monoamine oxidase family protein [Adhaeribacter pallidiroseus]|uniref:Tryptophan 2-monooxygenase n=1 Tax=Adhaeribacter pallidiroseus TaxID=2072847 RepID=A0A369QJU0_9BACT|nr:NAD(P)/FAD-dependent oxidoreductase [Adhaeribacter pallidiroseus]RDC65181.1 Monoamine oxidase [Adhaeribacter pallidiroseus]